MPVALTVLGLLVADWAGLHAVQASSQFSTVDGVTYTVQGVQADFDCGPACAFWQGWASCPEPNPCQNGGICNTTTGGWECECPFGFSGAVCGDQYGQLIPIDLSSASFRPNTYRGIAESSSIQWVDICGDVMAPMRPNQDYICDECHNYPNQPTSCGYNGAAAWWPAEEAYYLAFYGNVEVVSSSEAECAGLAYSCAGPSVTTDPFSASPGNSVEFYYKAIPNGDYYEVLIEALFCNTSTFVCSVADHALQDVIAFSRGSSMTDYAVAHHTFALAGSYVLRFHVGSYDATGLGVLGAVMFVKPFQLTWADVPTTTTTTINGNWTITCICTTTTTTTTTTTSTSTMTTTTTTTSTTLTPTTTTTATATSTTTTATTSANSTTTASTTTTITTTTTSFTTTTTKITVITTATGITTTMTATTTTTTTADTITTTATTITATMTATPVATTTSTASSTSTTAILSTTSVVVTTATQTTAATTAAQTPPSTTSTLAATMNATNLTTTVTTMTTMTTMSTRTAAPAMTATSTTATTTTTVTSSTSWEALPEPMSATSKTAAASAGAAVSAVLSCCTVTMIAILCARRCRRKGREDRLEVVEQPVDTAVAAAEQVEVVLGVAPLQCEEEPWQPVEAGDAAADHVSVVLGAPPQMEDELAVVRLVREPTRVAMEVGPASACSMEVCCSTAGKWTLETGATLVVPFIGVDEETWDAELHSTFLKAEGEQRLLQAVDALKRSPDICVQVQGFAGPLQKSDMITLAKMRTVVVQNFLRERGCNNSVETCFAGLEVGDEQGPRCELSFYRMVEKMQISARRRVSL